MTTDPVRLAVAVTTLDSERTIAETLASARPLADRMLVVDSGSSDSTLDVARQHGAEVVFHAWEGPVRQKQWALDELREARWILLLDSDEALDAELVESIRRVLEDDDPRFAAWSLNRKVWFLGDWLHYTYQPEWRTRLVRGGMGRVAGMGADGAGGHDRLEVSPKDGSVGRLKGVCRHDSWSGMSDLLRRGVGRAERAALFVPKGGRAIDIVFRPGLAFLKQYVLRRGFLDGRRGFLAAAGVFAQTQAKHVLIAESRLRKNDVPPRDSTEHPAAPEPPPAPATVARATSKPSRPASPRPGSESG